MSFGRYRFLTNADDYRPVKFPPPGPYWCTGYVQSDEHPSGDRAIIIAILPLGEQLAEWWPDADLLETASVDIITFSERFPRPTWWQPILKAVQP